MLRQVNDYFKSNLVQPVIYGDALDPRAPSVEFRYRLRRWLASMVSRRRNEAYEGLQYVGEAGIERDLEASSEIEKAAGRALMRIMLQSIDV